jgi:hypothetical protein
MYTNENIFKPIVIKLVTLQIQHWIVILTVPCIQLNIHHMKNCLNNIFRS